MSRKTARRHAFHLVYQIPFHCGDGAQSLAEAKAGYIEFLADDKSGLDGMESLKKPQGRDAEYVDKTLWGVFDKQRQLDGVIEKFLTNWTLDRIGKVDLALLRLSIYEMLSHDDVPLDVAINEAVELAKQYGTDESPRFVNGVLSGVSRAIKEKGRADVAG